MKHVMIDCETLGVGTAPVILSLGAVRFDPEAAPGPRESYPSFYRAIRLDSCLATGLTINYSTLKWWLDQAPEARAAAFPDEREQVSLVGALTAFRHWCGQTQGLYNGVIGPIPQSETVWSHGIGSDVAWVMRAAERAGVPSAAWPFKYNASRDTRTLFDLVPPAVYRPEGTPEIAHHALIDAWQQAMMVQRATRWLRLRIAGYPEPRLPGIADVVGLGPPLTPEGLRGVSSTGQAPPVPYPGAATPAG